MSAPPPPYAPSDPLDAAQRPRGVCVLGTSRSGTSAVAGMFVRGGFFAGRRDDVYPADETNPAGHNENLGVVMQNERLLWALGGTLVSPPPAAPDEDTRQRGVALLRSELQRVMGDADHAPLVIKDPRIAVMLPIWSAFVPGLLHPVLVVRHPVEIARSLARRDGVPMPIALAIWEVHVANLLAHLHGQDVSVAPYAKLIGDEEQAAGIVREVAAVLSPAQARSIDAAGAGAAFRRELYHNRAAAQTGEAHLTDGQRRLWRYLASLAPGFQRLAAPDGVRTASESARHTVAAEGRRIVLENELRVELSRRHDRNIELEAELSRVRGRNLELEGELSEIRGLSVNAELAKKVTRRWWMPARVSASARQPRQRGTEAART